MVNQSTWLASVALNRTLSCCRQTDVRGSSSIHPSSVRGQEQKHDKGDLLPSNLCNRYQQYPVRVRRCHRCDHCQQPPGLRALLTAAARAACARQPPPPPPAVNFTASAPARSPPPLSTTATPPPRLYTYSDVHCSCDDNNRNSLSSVTYCVSSQIESNSDNRKQLWSWQHVVSRSNNIDGYGSWNSGKTLHTSVPSVHTGKFTQEERAIRMQARATRNSIAS